jgi:hypothetical protein
VERSQATCSEDKMADESCSWNETKAEKLFKAACVGERSNDKCREAMDAQLGENICRLGANKLRRECTSESGLVELRRGRLSEPPAPSRDPEVLCQPEGR